VPETRRGRPPSTSARELELIALRLFAERGYDETTVDQIAREAGVSRRTFFRYFDAKSGVLWHAFDDEVANLRSVLATLPTELPVLVAVRRAVLAVNHYSADDIPELRARMTLISTSQELAASAATHYDAWERAISEFVGQRTRQPPESLYPLTVGRVTLAACRAAYERWAELADADLRHYLDAALVAVVLGPEPSGKRRRPRPTAR
jgi:mycofactocin system transcriptional regulator